MNLRNLLLAAGLACATICPAQFRYSPTCLSFGSATYKQGYDISIGGMNGLLMRDGKRCFKINLNGGTPALCSHGNIVFRDPTFGYLLLRIERSYVQSDQRAKTNIKTLDLTADMLDPMRPVVYDTPADKGSNRAASQVRQAALDPVSLAEILPALVKTDESGETAINYMALTPILIGILKDLNAAADEQEQIITMLQNAIEKQKNTQE